MSGMFESKADGASRRQARYDQESQARKKSKKLTIIVIAVFLILFLISFTLNSVFIRRTLPILTVGDVNFTVVEFEYFFNTEVTDYSNAMWQFMGVEGQEHMVFDRDLPLSAQTHEETGGTWTEYFEQRAIDTMTNLAVVYTAAREVGFTISEEHFENIDAEVARYEESAEMFEIPLELMLQHLLGYAITEEIFRSILEFVETANAFSEYMRTTFIFTTEQKRQYFNENREDLGFFDDGDYYTTTFRHILIMPDEVNFWDFDLGMDDPEYIELSERAAAEATVRAEEVWDRFVGLGSTEAALIQLVEEGHSDDTAPEGLYENIAKAHFNGVDLSAMQVVIELQEWLFYEGREIGDVEMVRTADFGYHIMYFLGYGDKFFEIVAEDGLRTQSVENWSENLPGRPASRRFGFFLVSV